MKVSYKGVHHDLPPKLQEKLDLKFIKLAKLLDGPLGEKSAHVILKQERHLHKAEITLHFYDHQLVGIGADGDIFIAMSAALAKLEKQAVKHSGRWRESARRLSRGSAAPAGTPKAPETEAEPRPRTLSRKVFRPRTHERRKPITFEEALLIMEDGRDYLVYRNASDQERVTMLVRRADGHLDLIEA